MRATPFALVFAELATERFPAIAAALDGAGVSSADRDHFVLLEPVGRLLRELVPPDSGGGPDALEAHSLLLHHAYRHWAAHGWVYAIAERTLERATGGAGRITSQLPRPALYLQLPELRVWGTPTPGDAAPGLPEPLDGVFVTETAAPGVIALLAIFGLREGREGFSAVGLEGRADPGDAMGGEIEVAAARADGTPAFAPTVAGGGRAGLLSLANHGELLLLTCRLLAQLPAPSPRDDAAAVAAHGERLVEV